MERMKKILIIIGVLLIIAIIVIGIREFLLWNEGKLDKSNLMTREEIIVLLDKGATYPNYSYSGNTKNKNEVNVECYVKDNIARTYIAGTSKLISVIDYNTGLNKTYWKMKDGEVKEAEFMDNTMKYTQHGCDYSYIADYDTFKADYEYLGEKEFEGRRAIIIQMNNQKDDKFGSSGARFIIDKETGLILARTDFSRILFVTVYKNFDSRNVKFDT